MMRCPLPIAALMLALASPALATQTDVYVLTSLSDTRAYGLLLTAPPDGCGRVRYTVQGPAGFLGHTPPLAPGQAALVRMGRGFAPGDHVLTISAAGCKPRPALARRVVLAKASPDHGWRWPQ